VLLAGNLQEQHMGPRFFITAYSSQEQDFSTVVQRTRFTFAFFTCAVNLTKATFRKFAPYNNYADELINYLNPKSLWQIRGHVDHRLVDYGNAYEGFISYPLNQRFPQRNKVER